MLNKKCVAVSLAIVLGMGAQFVQLGDNEGALNIGMQRAEAGIFDKIGGTMNDMKNKAVKGARKQAKDSVNKALEINIDGMNNHRADMEHHMKVAAAMFAGSEYQIGQAVHNNDGNTQKMGVIYNALINGNGSMSLVYDMTATPRISSDELKAALYADSKDKAAHDEMVQHMRWSKDYQTKALFVCGLAARDASFLIKESAKGIKDAKNVDSLKSQLEGFKNSADDVVKVVKFIKSNIAKRNAVRKDFDKKNNIKGPSEKEKKEFAASLGAE